MLWVSSKRCNNEALKNCTSKAPFRCFKEVKIDKLPDLSYSFLSTDCCVRMVNLTVYSVVMFSHRYLDSHPINFKTFVFLAVYWSTWTLSYNTDIKVKKNLNGASTMLNNVFKYNTKPTKSNQFAIGLHTYIHKFYSVSMHACNTNRIEWDW